MKIEFGQLRIGQVARQHINECLDKNWISAGAKVKLFEEGWGRLFNYPFNVAMSSGTDACIAACLALYDFGAQPGDEIIVPALSFIATANAIRAAGFTPVFVDVKKETLNIDEDQIENYISNRTRAIMVVHTMGKPCNMDRINQLLHGNYDSIVLIEDCCEAHGAKYKQEFVGTRCDMACFSFYAAHLICCGEGGMVSTRFREFENLLRSVRSHGRTPASLYFNHFRFGLNFKMNDLEASVGLEGIEQFWEIFQKRHDHMIKIRDGLNQFDNVVWFSEEDDRDTNCPHGFSITCREPGRINNVKKALDEAGIHHKRNFGSNPTQHKAFEYLGYELGDFPNAEYIGDNGIHIGLHPYLTDEEIGLIIKTISKGLTA